MILNVSLTFIRSVISMNLWKTYKITNLNMAMFLKTLEKNLPLSATNEAQHDRTYLEPIARIVNDESIWHSPGSISPASCKEGHYIQWHFITSPRSHLRRIRQMHMSLTKYGSISDLKQLFSGYLFAPYLIKIV